MENDRKNIPTIEVHKKSYERIKQDPLFFFNATEEWNYATRQMDRYWEPEAIYVSENKRNRLPIGSIDSNHREILLAYGIPNAEQLTENNEYIRLELQSFDPKNIEHVKAVLTLFLSKAHDVTDKYSLREFLWMLNSYFLCIPVLNNAIDAFDPQTIQPFFWDALKYHSGCLSLTKQRIIQQYLASKGITYNPCVPQSLIEALQLGFPGIDFNRENLSIFQLVQIAVNSDKYKDREFNSAALYSPTNFFLKVRKWMAVPSYRFEDFERLSHFFRLFSPNMQVLLIKRYFHAIRTGDVEFNEELLKSFQINKFDNWGIYYHCAHEASKPIRLAVPLLCDNILTFLNSGGNALQTINGTLDMAFAQSDINSPEVDFGLKHIVPICGGGAIPNTPQFPGFICYKKVYTLNESAFTPEAIIKSFRWYLTRWGKQQHEQTCFSEETTLEKCSLRGENLKACENCDSNGIRRLDKYFVRLNSDRTDDLKRTILNLYADIAFHLGKDIEVEPMKSLRSPNEVKTRIVSWLNNNLERVSGTVIKYRSGTEDALPDGWAIKEDTDSLFDLIIHDYLQPSWIRIEPRTNAYIGRGVLNKETGINETYLRNNGIQSLNDERIQRKEYYIIRPRIIEALNERLEVFPNNAGSYCIPYDEKLLRKLKADFYTHKEEENSSEFKETNIGFMKEERSKYIRYCAPKYENDVNLVTKLPFMWCRGKECFKTSLDNQTLVSCEFWERYTILHMLEILGFSQITHTSGGNEASDLIRSFIGMVNKASSLFKRVRCRECNHILFPLGQSKFNRYNNFECRLPGCGNRGRRVYLSQCYHCKTGLIDSRDSARCPNGLHICPRCLSCCNDDLYERLANTYILKNQPIPSWISEKLGHGHNDKGEYFCPKCGGRIVIVHDEPSDRTAKVCQACRAVYESI